MNEKIIIEMGSQLYSIEFLISFLTIYNNIVCTDGKVPAIIILLYGGISSYFSGGCYNGPVSENLNAAKTPEQVRWTQPNYGSMIRDLNVVEEHICLN